MKILNIILVVTVAIYLVNSNLSYAAENKNHQTSDDLRKVFRMQDVTILFSSSDSKIILAKDSDRGCCFWKTEKGACTYTSEGFCRVKAKEANVKFEFYLNKSCRELTVCK